MIELAYQGTYNTAVLYEQIRAAFPELYDPVQHAILPGSGDRFSIQPQEGQLVILLPDDFTPRVEEFNTLIAAHDPSEETKQVKFRSKIANLAQSAANVRLQDLTQMQIKALMAVLLYKAGGVDAQTMTVKPLQEWL